MTGQTNPNERGRVSDRASDRASVARGDDSRSIGQIVQDEVDSTDWAELEAERTRWALLYNETFEKLEAMTRARDLCKRQADEAGARWTGVLSWLRENHPVVYEQAMAWGEHE